MLPPGCGTHGKVFKTFAWKNRPESGLDCLIICAEFARQRSAWHAWRVGNHHDVILSFPEMLNGSLFAETTGYESSGAGAVHRRCQDASPGPLPSEKPPWSQVEGKHFAKFQ